MSASTLPTKRSIEDKIAQVTHAFNDPKRRNAIPTEWGEYIRSFSEHVKRRSVSEGAAAKQQQQESGESASAAASVTTPTVPSTSTAFDAMVTLIAVMDQNLLKSQNKELRRIGLGLIRDTIVIPAAPPAPRSQAPAPSVASRTLRLQTAPMQRIVTALLQMFHDNDDSVRNSALETLKFYIQVDNEVVYCHMEEITLQTLMVLPPGQDKRQQAVLDFLTSLTEVLRNQMRSQRTDQAAERGEPLPPVFSMPRFITLVVRGLQLAAERKSDSICAALVGKYLGLIDGSDDANILQHFHRLIGPLLELVKYRETANPINVYLIQQQRSVEAWVQSHLLYEPKVKHEDPSSAARVVPSHSPESAAPTPRAEVSVSGVAKSGSDPAVDGINNNNNNTHLEATQTSSKSGSTGGSIIVGFNRVAALDAVIERFETLNPVSCTAYSHALTIFLHWLVLLMTFRVPPGSQQEPKIPQECGGQVSRILAQILSLDASRTQTLHERLELVYRRWPEESNSHNILQACLTTFSFPDKRVPTLLKWVGHVVALCYNVASARREDINRALMECMNDAKEVHALALHLMCRLAKTEKSLWELFLAGIVGSMAEFKARIPTCFCMLQQFSAEVDFDSSFVVVAASKYIQRLNDKAFKAAMVKTLSLLICTAGEFDSLRKILRTGTAASHEAKATFDALFHCWACNAAWSVGLCLLTREFQLANSLVEEIASGDVSAFVLEQLHRVIQLFESPCFSFARIALLRPKENPFLVRTLFGVLMLLPQESSSFGLLNKRLECVAQQQQALASLSDTSSAAVPESTQFKIALFTKTQTEMILHEVNH